jgi:DNA-binding Lrp family transcriptional regulator
MARTADPQGADQIVRVLEQHPDGAAIDQLAQAISVSRRTLQRRLAALMVSGTVRGLGGGRQRRYQLVANRLAEPGEIAVSRAGQQVRALVRRPMIHRPPVGYVASLLESYRPNFDFYLDADLRGHLHDLGRVLGPARPAGTYARQILSRLLVDLSWASSRLEGNTYTRLDTQNLIELGRHAPGKDQREAQMILNHKAAIETHGAGVC